MNDPNDTKGDAGLSVLEIAAIDLCLNSALVPDVDLIDPEDDFEWDDDEDWDDDLDWDDPMDGDHDSAMASAGFGTDEDYGCYGGGEDW